MEKDKKIADLNGQLLQKDRAYNSASTIYSDSPRSRSRDYR